MDQRQFEATLADAEIRLRRLRMLYDQWFHGLERIEPRTQRSDVDRIITDLRRAQPRNTALRFRFNQLVQRYTTYNTYWQRITRQIEEGTYKRDVLRARKRFSEGDAETDARRSADGYDLDLDIDIEATLDALKKSEPPAAAVGTGRSSSRPPPSSDRPLRALRDITPFAMPAVEAPPMSGSPTKAAAAPAPLPVVPPRPSAPPPLGHRPGVSGAAVALSRKPPPLPEGRARNPGSMAPGRGRSAPVSAAINGASGNGVSDAQIKNIYQRYLDARRQNRERTDNVKLETVAKTVRDMMPKLSQKHAGKQIDFEVVVKDGRVALKPVAK